MYMIPYTRNNNASLMDLFDEFERSVFGENGRRTPMFSTDIKDEGDKYVLIADMPGFSKDDIKLDVDSDVLTVSAERHSEHEDKDKKGKYIRCERSYGSYQRSFDVSGVKTEDIKAKYENGVLTLDMPKKTETIEGKRRLAIE